MQTVSRLYSTGMFCVGGREGGFLSYLTVMILLLLSVCVSINTGVVVVEGAGIVGPLKDALYKSLGVGGVMGQERENTGEGADVEGDVSTMLSSVLLSLTDASPMSQILTTDSYLDDNVVDTHNKKQEVGLPFVAGPPVLSPILGQRSAQQAPHHPQLSPPAFPSLISHIMPRLGESVRETPPPHIPSPTLPPLPPPQPRSDHQPLSLANAESVRHHTVHVQRQDGSSVSVPAAAVLELARLSEGQREQLEGLMVERVVGVALGTPLEVDKVFETKGDVHFLIDSVIDHHKSLTWNFPLQDIVNATMTGGIYPTAFPGQLGPVPTKSDVICNPEVMPCSSLGAWGRSIGIPLRNTFKNSFVGGAVKRGGDVVNHLEEEATAGITPTLINYLELEPTVSTIEVLASTLSPVLSFDAKTSPIWHTLRNVTETAVWQPLDFIDKPEENKAVLQLARAKTEAAMWCRMFNGRLPNCDMVTNVTYPGIPVRPTPPVIDPATGFMKYIFVWGFEMSCRLQFGCVSGTPSLQPENFDGVYILSGQLDNGQPLYSKADFFFKDFNSLKILFFWQRTVRFSNPLVFPDLGTWAAITPTLPSYEAVVQGSSPPFAFVEPGEDKGVSPPSPCTNTIGRAQDGNFRTTFPTCLNLVEKWRFGRANSGGCSGMRVNNLCYFPVLNTVFPVNSTNPITTDGTPLHPMLPSYTGMSYRTADPEPLPTPHIVPLQAAEVGSLEGGLRDGGGLYNLRSGRGRGGGGETVRPYISGYLPAGVGLPF
eukprot:GHVQ01015003.1.p1 GENE.GHVQ01015003.1~~GHVQ01015003.1.p1  ORF type:complete len:768 (-),score=117.05 GHVQ01015003.1:672-2975(-)